MLSKYKTVGLYIATKQRLRVKNKKWVIRLLMVGGGERGQGRAITEFTHPFFIKVCNNPKK